MNAPEPRRLLAVAPSPNAQHIAALNEAIGAAEDRADHRVLLLRDDLRALSELTEHDGIVMLEALAAAWEESDALSGADGELPRKLRAVILLMRRQMLDDEAPNNCDTCGGDGRGRWSQGDCTACSGSGKAVS